MHKQALGRKGSACSSAGRNGSAKISSNIPRSCSSSRQQVTARAHGPSNANTVAMLAQAPTRASSRQLGSKVSRRHTCVVRSVLADAPSQAVEGCPRGGHWQVHKFGGTCMASPSRLRAAADLVSPSYWEGCLAWQHWSNCCHMHCCYSCCCC